MFDLKGKRALVTGSTQGIGLDIAALLAHQGAEVFIHGATSMEKCLAATSGIPGAHAVCVDLTEHDAADRLYDATGDVDILVLCASVQYKKEWDAYTEEEYDIQFDCNVKASYFLMKKYSEGMKKNGWGRIIAVGSVNQYNQHPALSLYGATKVAQNKLVQNIAPALAPYGITVNNIAPGAIETPRNAGALADEDFRHRVESQIPTGRIGTTADVSPAVLLLASDEGAYITGADIVIDGGMHLR